MHIGFITPEYPHPNLKSSGGLGTSIKNLSLGLINSGVSVTIFVVYQNQDLSFHDGDVNILAIKHVKYFVLGWYKERKRIQNIIVKHIHEKKIDILEAPDWTGITAFMKFKCPLIIRLNGSDAYFCSLEKRKQKWKNFFFERKALTNANAIVSVSTFTANITKKIFGLKHNIKTIHNGINIKYFEPLNIPVIRGQLLYFGTIIRKKGVLELAQAFNLVIEKMPKASLLLIGKDVNDIFENKSTLQLFYKQLSYKAKQQVTQLQEVSYLEIKRYIAQANIVVLPSFAEAFPMTWLETLAMEKALISSNIGWANELMVNEETGYTIDPKNHEEFSNKIINLLQDENKCNTFGKNGRKWIIKRFSSQVITCQNIDFYKQQLKS
jgi:L-malate glycosyltransferase